MTLKELACVHTLHICKLHLCYHSKALPTAMQKEAVRTAAHLFHVWREHFYILILWKGPVAQNTNLSVDFQWINNYSYTADPIVLHHLSTALWLAMQHAVSTALYSPTQYDIILLKTATNQVNVSYGMILDCPADQLTRTESLSPLLRSANIALQHEHKQVQVSTSCQPLGHKPPNQDNQNSWHCRNRQHNFRILPCKRGCY